MRLIARLARGEREVPLDAAGLALQAAAAADPAGLDQPHRAADHPHERACGARVYWLVASLKLCSAHTLAPDLALVSAQPVGHRGVVLDVAGDDGDPAAGGAAHGLEVTGGGRAPRGNPADGRKILVAAVPSNDAVDCSPRRRKLASPWGSVRFGSSGRSAAVAREARADNGEE